MTRVVINIVFLWYASLREIAIYLLFWYQHNLVSCYSIRKERRQSHIRAGFPSRARAGSQAALPPAVPRARRRADATGVLPVHRLSLSSRRAVSLAHHYRWVFSLLPDYAKQKDGLIVYVCKCILICSLLGPQLLVRFLRMWYKMMRLVGPGLCEVRHHFPPKKKYLIKSCLLAKERASRVHSKKLSF